MTMLRTDSSVLKMNFIRDIYTIFGFSHKLKLVEGAQVETEIL